LFPENLLFIFQIEPLVAREIRLIVHLSDWIISLRKEPCIYPSGWCRGRNSTAGLIDFNVELGENRYFGLCFGGESKKSDFLSETAIFFLVLLRLLVV
jgi:hypothetical protein